MESKYSEFINGIELQDIYLGSAKFKRHAFPDSEKFPEVRVTFTPGKSKYISKHGELCIDQEISFLLEEVASEKDKSRKLFDLTGQYTLVYSSRSEINDELFEMFKKRNVPVNLHPYVRELVHNSMTRAGLPSYVLPALKIKR